MPPKISISLTIWPFDNPPIAGLQDILPIARLFMVIKAVLQPSFKDINEASIPACPPPHTTTSYDFIQLFTYTHMTKNIVNNVIGCSLS